MLPADFPYYFCGLPFRPYQVGRKLKWLLGLGDIRPVMKGVYVDYRVPDSPQLRADALRLLTPPEAVVCGPAAAWLHGLEATALGPAELVEAQWTRTADDVVEMYGVRVTSPIATAVQLAMRLPRPFALSAVDAFLRSGKADRWALRAASAAYEHSPGYRQAQDVLRWADRPADGRRLGLEYDSDQWHSSTKQQLKDETRRTELDALGWHIISVRRPDLWGSYPALELAVGSFLCQEPRLPRRW